MTDVIYKEWRCFHCDEVFTTIGAAEEHFGATEGAEPGCKIDQVAVEEGGKPERGRGLLMALRKAEAEIRQLRRDCEELENDSRLWHESEADRVRRIGHVQWWQELDSREGERLVLIERATKAEQDLETVKAERSAHDKAIGTFLTELHAILVDPLAEGTITVDEMRTTLIKAAIRDRDAVASLSQELETVKGERNDWKHRAEALFNGDVAKALASLEETDLRARAAERLAHATRLEHDQQRWSITYGELPPSVMPLIESHIWDNKNISEQRDWALQQLVLALAHDTQPYPTAEAYESVCRSRREWQARAEQAERELHKIQKMAKSLTIEDAIASFGDATDTLSWFKAIAAARLAQAKAEQERRVHEQMALEYAGRLEAEVAQHAKVRTEKNALAYDKACLHEDIRARTERLRTLVVEARRKAPTFGVQEWEWLLGELHGLVEP